MTCNIFVTEQVERRRRRRRRRAHGGGKNYFLKLSASQSFSHLPGPHLWPFARSLARSFVV